jgi:hypothetical protein
VPVTLAQLQLLLQVAYDEFVVHLGLSPLRLDVYEIDDSGDGGRTPLGTDRRNDAPGYTPTYIILPQAPGDLAAWDATQPTFPPSIWNRHTHDWPAWRTDLWHEVVHQYQHQILNAWNPRDAKQGHEEGWPDAVRDVAASFGIAPLELLDVI